MITIPKASMAGMDMKTIKNEQLKETLIKKTEEKTVFKIPVIVKFFLWLIVAYYGVSICCECSDKNWVLIEEVYHYNITTFGRYFLFYFVAVLDALSLVSIGLLLLRKKIGYTMLIIFSSLVVFVMGVYSIGLGAMSGDIMYRALSMPALVYGILQIKADNGECLWQNLGRIFD